LDKEEEIDLFLATANYKENLQNIFKQKKKLSGVLKFIDSIDLLILDMNSILSDLDDNDLLIIFDDLLNEYYSQMNGLYFFMGNNAKFSKNECYLNFQSSTGGLESENLNYILFKEYLVMLDKNKIKHEVIEADIQNDLVKNATVKINEPWAYLFFKNEKGAHRFTRISPYGNGKLHTSFVFIDVYPHFDEKDETVINKKDIRVDTFRGSGAGGQHRNKTDSAVRITHIPSNIVVKIESERSQHTNKKIALSLLTARVYERELFLDKSENDISGRDSFYDWGNQIRSYTIEQNRVKDHRTENIFNGNIDKYFSELNSYIKNNNSIIVLRNFKV